MAITAPAITKAAPRIADAERRNWLVWFDRQWLSRWPVVRGVVARYFRPSGIERLRDGALFRLVGVQFVAYVIPTGGMLWRRLFGWDGWSFALAGPSIRAASEFRYSTCVFEILHLTAFLLMLPDGLWAIWAGYTDGILKFALAGVFMNGYPILLQRYNRVRIHRLLVLANQRKRTKEGRCPK